MGNNLTILYIYSYYYVKKILGSIFGLLLFLGVAGTTNASFLKNGEASLEFTIAEASGTDDAAYQAPVHAPEPATMVLFGIGLLGLAGVFRKKEIGSQIYQTKKAEHQILTYPHIFSI